ncbi:hypothetical protein GGS24DRAFT_506497 [Hypoxylon argillaceum]|nr:hypothetical protein GGS24DRAFT_506497 [Hypoxylon argillaceum]
MTHSLIDSDKSSTNSDNEASPFVRLLCTELSGPTFLDVVEEIPTAFDAEIYGPGTGWLETILEDALWQTLGDCNEQAASPMDMLRMRDPNQAGRAITHTLERIYKRAREHPGKYWLHYYDLIGELAALEFQRFSCGAGDPWPLLTILLQAFNVKHNIEDREALWRGAALCVSKIIQDHARQIGNKTYLINASNPTTQQIVYAGDWVHWIECFRRMGSQESDPERKDIALKAAEILN